MAEPPEGYQPVGQGFFLRSDPFQGRMFLRHVYSLSGDTPRLPSLRLFVPKRTRTYPVSAQMEHGHPSSWVIKRRSIRRTANQGLSHLRLPFTTPASRFSPLIVALVVLLLAAVGTGCGSGDSTTTVIHTTAPDTTTPLCSEVASGEAALGDDDMCIDDD